MREFAITFARSARKELEALDAKLIERVLTRIEASSLDCRPTGSKKLAGTTDLWRI